MIYLLSNRAEGVNKHYHNSSHKQMSIIRKRRKCEKNSRMVIITTNVFTLSRYVACHAARKLSRRKENERDNRSRVDSTRRPRSPSPRQTVASTYRCRPTSPRAPKRSTMRRACKYRWKHALIHPICVTEETQIARISEQINAGIFMRIRDLKPNTME